MNINQAIKNRIILLCDDRHRSHTLLLPQPDSDITLEAVETICDELQITIADFFCSDLFRNLERN